jgi:hypothetical protein
VSIGLDQAEQCIPAASHEEAHTVFFGRDLVIAKGPRIREARRSDGRDQMETTLIVDPVQPMRRMEVAGAVHLFLTVGSDERREGCQRVEQQQHGAARNGEGTPAELAPEDPGR